jgi:homoserine dehydrogenase
MPHETVLPGAPCAAFLTPVDTEGLASSGPSPTERIEPTQLDPAPLPLAPPARVWLIGAGAVGREFLRLLPRTRLRLIGVSDTSASLYAPSGLDALAIAAHKQAGRALAECTATGARFEARLAEADIVVDASSAGDLAVAGARARAILARGQSLVLAGKDVACAHAHAWFREEAPARVGIDAALGGTGWRLASELRELRARWTSIALACNASSAAIIEAVARGASFEQGLAQARERGLLETDATRDLDGSDAACKLALVLGALTGRALDPAHIERTDLRALDARLLRERARRGRATRLVARARKSGTARIACEELEPGSALAAPPDRVVYCYELERGARRVHVGHGLGAARTARALLGDTLRLAASALVEVRS